jgi:hypothetical protein
MAALAYFVGANIVAVAAAFAALVWYRPRFLPLTLQFYGGFLSFTLFGLLVPVGVITLFSTLIMVSVAPRDPVLADLQSQAFGPESIVQMWFFAAGAFTGTYFSAKTFRRAQNHYRSQEARDLYNWAKNGDPLPYYVYLRPLRLGHVKLKNPSRPFLPIFPSFFSEPRRVDFDYYMQECLPEAVVTIGLGAEELPGRCLRVDDSEWQHAFMVLSEHALGIVMVPSTTEGVLWELSSLRDHGRLEKTVLVEPPGFPADRWNEVAVELQSHGVMLPPHSRSGQVFKLGGELRPNSVTPIRRWSWRHPRWGFASVVSRLSERKESTGGTVATGVRQP